MANRSNPGNRQSGSFHSGGDVDETRVFRPVSGRAAGNGQHSANQNGAGGSGYNGGYYDGAYDSSYSDPYGSYDGGYHQDSLRSERL